MLGHPALVALLRAELLALGRGGRVERLGRARVLDAVLAGRAVQVLHRGGRPGWEPAPYPDSGGGTIIVRSWSACPCPGWPGGLCWAPPGWDDSGDHGSGVDGGVGACHGSAGASCLRSGPVATGMSVPGDQCSVAWSSTTGRCGCSGSGTPAAGPGTIIVRSVPDSCGCSGWGGCSPKGAARTAAAAPGARRAPAAAGTPGLLRRLLPERRRLGLPVLGLLVLLLLVLGLAELRRFVLRLRLARRGVLLRLLRLRRREPARAGGAP
ncbi:hypothetical protein [Actinomadura madurae]|uniref:hypothetical protein n=1 Tax=Actinomadura madurae TaxID=1993 RepID=UPI0020D2422C|nr:hypothetical protein [Actinomadura madurae]MCQ0018465.1 hypothetical protein [Actinomadura madurae]